MKIVIFSVGPIFREHVHGGSQKILREVATYLGQVGHCVTILCTARKDNFEQFHLAPNVTVSPTLKFKETYPEPYYTAPYNLANIILEIRRATDKADVLYLHDGELLYHFLYKDVPTIVSLRDFVYPDTLAGGLSFQRDLLVLNSEYMAGCVKDAFSAFRPGVADRIRLIPNGVNLDHFQPQATDTIRRLINLTENAIPILYPHRPDPRKGIYEAVEAIAGLRQRLGSAGDRLRLLIPIWMDGKVTISSNHVYQTIYDEVKTYAANLGVSDLLSFHPWVPYDLMPQYYSLARATLCLGNFVEACSNVSIEASACGSPCVVARVASHRSLLPETFTWKVGYGNLEATVDALQSAIEKPLDVQAVRDFIASRYSYQAMLISYEKVLTSNALLPPLREEYTTTLTEEHTLKLPTWCDYYNGQCYNDYHYGYDNDPDLLSLLKQDFLPSRVSEIIAKGVHFTTLEKLLRDGSLAISDIAF